jgi:predicted transcriptional regulator
MRASEVMIHDPVVVAAGATSAEVATLMQMKDISVVPVVDNPKDRRYLGTISDRDIVTRCVAQGHDPSDCAVETHLRQDTAVVAPETELKGYQLTKPADEHDSHVRATIVVVDKDRKVVGFIPHPEEVAGIRISP